MIGEMNEWELTDNDIKDWRVGGPEIAYAAQKKLLEWLDGFCDHAHSNAYAPLKQLRFLCPNCMADLRGKLRGER